MESGRKSGPWLGHQSGIYQITCSANGKRYIGSATRLRVRHTQHFRYLTLGKHSNRELQSAWRKYGADSFSFQVLLVCSPDDLMLYEQRAIDGLRHEFNRCPVAFSTRGRKYTPEALARITESNRKRGADPAFRALRSTIMKGTSASPETRAKLSAALKGRKRPPEIVAKMVAGWAARRERLGLPHPEPRKPKGPKIPERKGARKDAAWRAALSAAVKGKKRPRKSNSNQLTLEV